MKQRIGRVALMLGCVLSASLGSVTAHAAKGVALVIGNSAYRQATPLPNPVNDASAIASSLRRLQFDVIEVLDADRLRMEDALFEFGEKAEKSKIAMVFYAGHGVQVDGINYLVPVDGDMSSRRDLRRMIVLNDVMAEASLAKDVSVVVLDACRDNPFQTTFTEGLTRSGSATRGLARIGQAPTDVLVAYATEANFTADDGDGAHSPYTTALLQHMETPGLELQFMFREVRDSVMKMTDNKQRPFTQGSLGSERIYLAGEPQVAAAPSKVEDAVRPRSRARNKLAAPALDGENERLFWQTILAMQSGDSKIMALESYLDQYPGGKFASLANIQLTAERTRLAQAGAAGQQGGDRSTSAYRPAADDASTDRQLAAVMPGDRMADPEATPEEVETALRLNRSERRLVQESLTAIGYDTRGIDGSFGDNTRRAIEYWQHDSGYDTTGYLTANQYGNLLEEAKPAVAKRRATLRQTAATRRTDGSGPRIEVMNLSGVALSSSDMDRLSHIVRYGLGAHGASVTQAQLQITTASENPFVDQNAANAQIMSGILSGLAGLPMKQGVSPAGMAYTAAVTVVVKTRDKGDITESATVQRQGQGHQMSLLLQEAAQQAVDRAARRVK